jgi:DNA-binding MurR/RpiR family transcriptional regulator
MAGFPQDDIKAVAGRLSTAASVVVVGVRYVTPLTVYLTYTLRKLRAGVVSVTHLDSTAYDDLSLQPSDTVVVGIGFARYANELLEFLEFARKQHFETAVITDHAVSPLAKLGDHVLVVAVPPMKFMSFLAAPAAILNVLVLEVALRLGARGTDRLENLEDVAKAKGTYFADTAKDSRRPASALRTTRRRRRAR